MEWQQYVLENDLIIVTCDGYEPNLHPGKYEREGIRYGSAPPYDYMRAHETNDHHWGWNFGAHFREIVTHVDSTFRTIPDRSQRGLTGLSMGGQMSFYIGGQNKDLVSSVSAFDPADNYPLFGPKGRQVVLPNLELYRSLKGMAVRLTVTDGDWLKYNNAHLEKHLRSAQLAPFEFHTAKYPDHWAADIDKQLDFHMREFRKERQLPYKWNHVNAAYPNFEVLGYRINVDRTQPALTLLENISPKKMRILGRAFLPDGPVITDENLSVTTSQVYPPLTSFQIVSYNLTTGRYASEPVQSDTDGRLNFSLPGGGHVIGINEEGKGHSALADLVFEGNQERFYFEEGEKSSFSFTMINPSTTTLTDIEITASSENPDVIFKNPSLRLKKLNPAEKIVLKDRFHFILNRFTEPHSMGRVTFKIQANGQIIDTVSVIAYFLPRSRSVARRDVIILDGSSAQRIPVYEQGSDNIVMKEIAGGEGNGNGIPEAGEKLLVYIRIPQGMAPADTNTYHRCYAVNNFSSMKHMTVRELNYEEKRSQAGATSVASVLTTGGQGKKRWKGTLRFRVESLYNDKHDPASKATVYAHKYDYVKVRFK